VELYARVRRAVVVDKMSEREAAKQFGLARETVTCLDSFNQS
jgi:transposase